MNWLALQRWLQRLRSCKHHRWCDVVRGDGTCYRMCRDCGKVL